MAVLTKTRVLAKPRRIRVRPLRRWFGVSQEQFARTIGSSRATVQRWETAGSGPEPNSAEGRMVETLAQAQQMAVRLFGARRARAWFDDPAPTFGGKTPLQVLTSRGPIAIRDLLREAADGGY